MFLTGVGANALFDEAERQGRLSFLLESLSQATLVCRGPKPSAALKRRGLTPTLSAREPYTTSRTCSRRFEHRDLRNRHVVLVHYGERNDLFARALRARGAWLDELCLYEWQLPEDTRPMMVLVEDVVAGRVDTVVFTSQIQGRHLLQMAAEMGVRASFIDALNTQTCRGRRRSSVPRRARRGRDHAARSSHQSQNGSVDCVACGAFLGFASPTTCHEDHEVVCADEVTKSDHEARTKTTKSTKTTTSQSRARPRRSSRSVRRT